MIEKLAETLSKFIFAQLTIELKRQGHNLTGALIESFEAKIQEKTDSITIEFLMLKYAFSLNKGIKPSKIPYTIGGPPRGGTSKYIQGLIRFAQIKFKADKRRAKQIAFAIARKQKQKGYPLTGKIGFIDNVLKADSEAIENIIEAYFEESLNLLFFEFLNKKTI
tara:strand:- start:1048 stop:1542 length:495 start_codon:yes stop_codon:yes gene_type:complete